MLPVPVVLMQGMRYLVPDMERPVSRGGGRGVGFWMGSERAEAAGRFDDESL
jgi:hypothetical protein